MKILHLGCLLLPTTRYYLAFYFASLFGFGKGKSDSGIQYKSLLCLVFREPVTLNISAQFASNNKIDHIHV